MMNICAAHTDNQPPVMQDAFTVLVTGADYTPTKATDNIDTAPTVACYPPTGFLALGFNSKFTL
jgi:hypothetical protein